MHRYTDDTLDECCVREHAKLKKIKNFADDAALVGDLILFDGKVKPKDFIAWSRTLGVDFPCYQWLEEKKTKVAKEDDPRAYKSLQKIVMILLAAHRSKRLLEGKPHAIGNELENLAKQYKISIESKAIATKIEEILQMTEFENVRAILTKKK